MSFVEAKLKMMKKIYIGVGGRFHSDFMYEALSQLGHSPHLLTCFPKSRFAVPAKDIQNSLYPELVFRAAKYVGLESPGDHFKMKHLGRFIADKVAKSPSDVFIGWSSFALETLRRKSGGHYVVMRDSSHIEFQYQILKEEYAKFGFRFPQRQFCLDRELEEYQLADRIWVLSPFAKKTFIERSIPAEKIDILSLGVDLKRFYPLEPFVMELPLRILYFGNLSFRKGVHYLLEATKQFSPNELLLTLIGPIEPEFKERLNQYSHFHYFPAKGQQALAEEIRKHHVFVLPTLEDGFGQTLIQAMASGLVPITTTHCGAADFVFRDEDQWRVAPRSSEQIEVQLEKLLHSRERFMRLRAKAITEAHQLHWTQYQERLGQLLSNLTA